MIAHLWQYFGVLGCLSILVWLAALALLGRFARSPKRTRFWLYALATALAGLLLAEINSNVINHIKLDTTEDEADALQRRHDLEEEKKVPGTPQLHFAEDSPLDNQKTNTEAAVYDYRQQGKQQRIRPTNSAPTIVAAGAKPAIAEEHTRTLKAADLQAADQDDRINLFMARATFWLACLLVLVDYFSRVNKTFDHLVPLPLAGRFLDSIYPKSHAVCSPKRDEASIRHYLESTIRRGENFIYYGPTDPLPEAWLPRLQIKKWKFGRVTKLVSTAGGAQFDSDFIHESAWFSRYCFVILGDHHALQRRDELQKFLETRLLTRAFAWRTVHIVWNCDSPIPADVLKKFAALCREANFKLVVFSNSQPAPATPRIFEEVVA